MAERQRALWPVKWEQWEVPDAEVAEVRVAVQRASAGAGPTYPIEAVEVHETARDVIVTLYARTGASKLAAVTVGLAIPLRSPVGRRRVFDGVDGQRRLQLTQDPASESEDSPNADAIASASAWTQPTNPIHDRQ